MSGHDDQNASLAIWQNDDVDGRLECRAGCASGKIAAALGLDAAELSPGEVAGCSCDGFYEVVRIDADHTLQRRLDGRGGWTFDMTDDKSRLYRLQKLAGVNPGLRRHPAIVVEREEDVDQWWETVGGVMPATCNVGGLGKWEASYTQQLKDAGVRRVAVIADSGDESLRHAYQVAYACAEAGLRVQVVALPAPAKTVCEYIDAGHKDRELRALIEAAPPFSPPVRTPMSDVKPQPATWLWPRWIPVGSVTVLDGSPGVGKGLLAYDLAARVSTGRPMPDGLPAPLGPANVVLVTCDDVNHTVRPRLERAGADLGRIDHLAREGDGLPTSRDLAAVSAAVRAGGAKLVVLGPLPGTTAPSDPSYRDELRKTLAQLGQLAAQQGTAILVTRDLDEGTDGNPAHRGGGTGHVSGVRSRLIAAPDPDDARLAVLQAAPPDVSTKGAVSLTFAPVVHDDGIPSINWRPPTSGRGHRSSRRPGERRSDIDTATAFLRKELAHGPVPGREVERKANASGINSGARCPTCRANCCSPMASCACSPPSPARGRCRRRRASATPSVWSRASAGGSDANATRPARN